MNPYWYTWVLAQIVVIGLVVVALVAAQRGDGDVSITCVVLGTIIEMASVALIDFIPTWGVR